MGSIPLGIIANNFFPFDFGYRGTPIFRLIFAVLASALVGTIASKLVSKNSINTIKELDDATKEIASGNYSIRIDEKSNLLELNNMAHNFNLMAKDLAMTHIMNNDFIGNVSHEFKTPLAAIEGYATLLNKDDVSAEKIKEYSENIILNSKRLAKMTGNILLLSSLDNSSNLLNKSTFSLDEQIREIVLLFEKNWTEKNLELDIDLDEIDYLGDPELLSHVWQNLFSNAVKFCDENGTVNLKLSKSKNEINFTISNTGKGVSEEDKEKIFEKFYQADKSRSSKGNGLGLSIVSKVIELHRGKIEVSSELYKSTTFIVTLPL